MDFPTVLLTVLGVIVGLAVFYFLTKEAVRNGILEARASQLAAEKKAAERIEDETAERESL